MAVAKAEQVKKREREAKLRNDELDSMLLRVDDDDEVVSKDGLKKRSASQDGVNGDGTPKRNANGQIVAAGAAGAVVGAGAAGAVATTKKDIDDDEAPPNDWLGISFNFAKFSLAGSSLFFLVDSRSVPQEWVTAMTLMSVVCAMSFLNYIFMHDIWDTKNVLLSSIRYMDWFITVPLQIMQFWIVTYIVNPDVSAFHFQSF